MGPGDLQSFFPDSDKTVFSHPPLHELQVPTVSRRRVSTSYLGCPDIGAVAAGASEIAGEGGRANTDEETGAGGRADAGGGADAFGMAVAWLRECHNHLSRVSS